MLLLPSSLTLLEALSSSFHFIFSPSLFSFLTVISSRLFAVFYSSFGLRHFDARLFGEAHSLNRRTVVTDVSNEGTLLSSFLAFVVEPDLEGLTVLKVAVARRILGCTPGEPLPVGCPVL